MGEPSVVWYIQTTFYGVWKPKHVFNMPCILRHLTLMQSIVVPPLVTLMKHILHLSTDSKIKWIIMYNLLASSIWGTSDMRHSHLPFTTPHTFIPPCNTFNTWSNYYQQQFLLHQYITLLLSPPIYHWNFLSRNITVPTLAINALDDPFIDENSLPTEAEDVGDAPVRLVYHAQV